MSVASSKIKGKHVVLKSSVVEETASSDCSYTHGDQTNDGSCCAKQIEVGLPVVTQIRHQLSDAFTTSLAKIRCNH